MAQDMTIPTIVETADPTPGAEVAPAIPAAVEEAAPAAVEQTPAPAAVVEPPAPAAVLTQADIDRMVEDRVAAAVAEIKAENEPVVEPEVELPAGTETATGKMYTQEQLEEHGRVAANRMAQRFSDYAELSRRAAELPGLTEQLATERGQTAALAAERDQLQTEKMKLEVAIDRKLPRELALRLTGMTREEVEADAESLSKLAGVSGGGFGGGPSTAEGSPGNDFNASLREAAGFAA
jgi:hypothetical protein